MTTIIELVYNFLWGDLVTLPLPGGGTLGLPLLVILLIPTGIYFTIRTKFLPIRLFPDMVRALNEKKDKHGGLSSFQTLIVSTATRVGMGNLVGVVAAISAGGAGAVFWMWITALLGSSTAFIEGTLAQLHKEKDPLYGGYHGGPAYYMHHFFAKRKDGTYRKYSVLAVLFAISGLICWCGISQVISNSVTSAFENAFSIPPLATTIILVVLAAIITSEKCNCKSFGHHGSNHGMCILYFYCHYHSYTSRTDAGRFCTYFSGSIRFPPDCSRRFRCCINEWCKTRTVFQ